MKTLGQNPIQASQAGQRNALSSGTGQSVGSTVSDALGEGKKNSAVSTATVGDVKGDEYVKSDGGDTERTTEKNQVSNTVKGAALGYKVGGVYGGIIGGVAGLLF